MSAVRKIHFNQQSHDLATSILTVFMPHRRLAKFEQGCNQSNCFNCMASHLPKVLVAIDRKLPVTFVLPAFPGKSPNPNKVLGRLPDHAERLSLEFLNQLCQKIEKIYAPGARIILCSDGRVFGDVVGLRDEDVTTYQHEIEKIIADGSLQNLMTFNLESRYKHDNFEEMRLQMLLDHGEPLMVIQERIRRGKESQSSADEQETHRHYCGTVRFLFEDALRPDQTISRNALQKISRVNAYEVIRRSSAWSLLIENHFPDAVRLSIHPQACGAKKLGIGLLEGEPWMTPWHGVAVEVNGRTVLLKRTQAEELGATVVNHDGRPSHYVLNQEIALPILRGSIDEA